MPSTVTYKILFALSWTIVEAGRGLRGPVLQSAVSVKEFEASMLQEIQNFHKSEKGQSRLDAIQASLWPMYSALPKIRGGLSHTVSRYALHRYFMQSRQWFIRGLDPKSDHPVESSIFFANLSIRGNPVFPTLLQSALERLHPNRGLALLEISALVASLQDLARRDSHDRLGLAYSVLSLDQGAPLNASEANDLVATYMSIYLLGNTYNNWTADEILNKKTILVRTKRWATMYKDWIRKTFVHSSSMTGSEVAQFNLTSMTGLVDAMDAGFGALTAMECHALKHKLISMEGKVAGRLRLSDFYNASRVGTWSFIEKIDYLRRLGALDESNSSNPQVIIVNYVGSMPQCLQATGVYSVCCPNECETLMSSIERGMHDEYANAEQLLEIVGNLLTDTINKPRRLEKKLASRLRDIVDYHDGRLPIHGRLFAQWMHHAFPRECPYPHQAGTTSPMTADEWMTVTGQNTVASDSEMDEHIRPDDTCSPDSEPPWSHAEELMTSSEFPGLPQRGDRTKPAEDPPAQLQYALLMLVVISLLLYKILVWDRDKARKR